MITFACGDFKWDELKAPCNSTGMCTMRMVYENYYSTDVCDICLAIQQQTTTIRALRDLIRFPQEGGLGVEELEKMIVTLRRQNFELHWTRTLDGFSRQDGGARGTGEIPQ